MSLFWKTLILVTLVVASYFLLRSYFEIVAVVAGVVGVSVWVDHIRRDRTEEKRVGVEDLAAILGVGRGGPLGSFRVRENGVLIHLSSQEIQTGNKRLRIVDLASPIFRKTPLCFVVRPSNARLRESQLVENTRIPGTKFEYVLERIDLDKPWEGATNMVDLFDDIHDLWASELGGALPRAPATPVQAYFFNGRVCHTYALIEGVPVREALERLLRFHASFHLTVVEITDKVNFKLPV